jgi:hypothetical protein
MKRKTHSFKGWVDFKGKKFRLYLDLETERFFHVSAHEKVEDKLAEIRKKFGGKK